MTFLPGTDAAAVWMESYPHMAESTQCWWASSVSSATPCLLQQIHLVGPGSRNTKLPLVLLTAVLLSLCCYSCECCENTRLKQLENSWWVRQSPVALHAVSLPGGLWQKAKISVVWCWQSGKYNKGFTRQNELCGDKCHLLLYPAAREPYFPLLSCSVCSSMLL